MQSSFFSLFLFLAKQAFLEQNPAMWLLSNWKFFPSFPVPWVLPAWRPWEAKESTAFAAECRALRESKNCLWSDWLHLQSSSHSLCGRQVAMPQQELPADLASWYHACCTAGLSARGNCPGQLPHMAKLRQPSGSKHFHWGYRSAWPSSSRD